jgi:succinate dehydrogenase/fumarate reductase flavoprotein subunit
MDTFPSTPEEYEEQQEIFNAIAEEQQSHEPQPEEVGSKLTEDCQDYIDYLKVDRIINDGHHMLGFLWEKYGKEVVSSKLTELFNK